MSKKAKKGKKTKATSFYGASSPNQAVGLLSRLQTNLHKGAFVEPPHHWMASMSEFIGVRERGTLGGDVDLGYFPCLIYPLNPALAKALTERFEMDAVPELLIPNEGFVVFDNQTNLAAASFAELAQAKAFVLRTFPGIKCFRTKSLGVKSEGVNYADIPTATSTLSLQEWVDYFLNKENDYGFEANTEGLGVLAILEQLITHGAPQRLIGNLRSRNDLSEAYAYIETHQLTSYEVGLKTALDFESSHARIEGHNQPVNNLGTEQ